jgi:hypothetical protein
VQGHDQIDGDEPLDLDWRVRGKDSLLDFKEKNGPLIG